MQSPRRFSPRFQPEYNKYRYPNDYGALQAKIRFNQFKNWFNDQTQNYVNHKYGRQQLTYQENDDKMQDIGKSNFEQIQDGNPFYDNDNEFSSVTELLNRSEAPKNNSTSLYLQKS